ncbi:MAG TPA: LLM class flavin-dependent oxidoreductase [Anaerolineales bacterium]|nr:LLM class flavin-dependent oxidoreductase [Anaerolineales bacterium]
MKFAIAISNAGETGHPRQMAELAHIAEESGWEGIFLEDYIIHWSGPESETYDPWICLATIAMRTEHIRFGNMVTPLPRRRPWKVARELLSLDHLSNGRVVLGAGSGHNVDPGFNNTGEVIDPKRRARRLDEGLEIINGLLSGEPFSYTGEVYRIEEMVFHPRPIQQPRIPIWIGGAWPKKGPLKRAARWDGYFTFKEEGAMTPEDVVAICRASTELRGTLQGFDLGIGGSSRTDDIQRDREKMQAFAAAGVTWWNEFMPQGRFDEVRKLIARGPILIG